MFSSLRRIRQSTRLAVARRPWIRWLAIALTAAGAGVLVFGQLNAVENARRSWIEQRTVLIASRHHEPGEPLNVVERRLPVGAVPESAVQELDPGTLSTQRVAAGEVVTSTDVAHGSGPAAAADDGDIVVAIADPLLGEASQQLAIGLPVAVHSEGAVLAERAQIVAIESGVVFVALDASDAPSVSAAAQLRLASLAFLR